jgi:hypothetical protein
MDVSSCVDSATTGSRHPAENKETLTAKEAKKNQYGRQDAKAPRKREIFFVFLRITS